MFLCLSTCKYHAKNTSNYGGGRYSLAEYKHTHALLSLTDIYIYNIANKMNKKECTTNITRNVGVKKLYPTAVRKLEGMGPLETSSQRQENNIKNR